MCELPVHSGESAGLPRAAAAWGVGRGARGRPGTLPGRVGVLLLDDALLFGRHVGIALVAVFASADFDVEFFASQAFIQCHFATMFAVMVAVFARTRRFVCVLFSTVFACECLCIHVMCPFGRRPGTRAGPRWC
jgi:hypothetical protein